MRTAVVYFFSGAIFTLVAVTCPSLALGVFAGVAAAAGVMITEDLWRTK